jgi:hypothetical protein
MNSQQKIKKSFLERERIAVVQRLANIDKELDEIKQNDNICASN